MAWHCLAAPLALHATQTNHAVSQVDNKKKAKKELVPKPTSGDPHELHLLTFKTQPCKDNCANVYLCTRFHSCEDRRRPLLIFADANVPNYQPVMCNALKGSAVCLSFLQRVCGLRSVGCFLLIAVRRSRAARVLFISPCCLLPLLSFQRPLYTSAYCALALLRTAPVVYTR
jgi:hypothetical protein